jgi:uncharacterized membrane protein
MVIVPLVLLLGTALARLAGWMGLAALDSWPAAVRVGLAAMLLLTASGHFTALRHDLARMMPPAIPYPMELVYFTGVCEILGAIGLLVPAVRVATGWALIVFFLAILPANVRAARAGLTIRGERATPLPVRIPLQAVFIALTWWSAVYRAGVPPRP